MKNKKRIYSGEEIAVYLLEDCDFNYVDASVSCGIPTETGQEQIETIRAYEALDAGSSKAYLVQVLGDSMINAGIEAGDSIVINTELIPDDGDIVLAANVDEQLLKYYHVDSLGNKWLVPANNNYRARKISDDTGWVIRGVMTSHIKLRRRSNAIVLGELDKLCSDELEVIRSDKDIPSWACTNYARSYFRVVIDAGYLMENLQPVKGTAIWQMGGIADRIGDLLGMRSKWKTFGELWSINKDHLRSSWNESRDLEKGNKFQKILLDKIN